MTQALQLDVAGTPQAWLSPQQAARLVYTQDVAWTTGPVLTVLHGGTSRLTGIQSVMEVPSILATRSRAGFDQAACTPSLTRHNHKLFARDRHLCGYCGQTFAAKSLTREHVFPVARGGRDVWTNVVTACVACNHRKAARTPEEANMPLLYLPYTPNWFEDFILRRSGRRVLADQMEFLMSRVPASSRLHA